MISFLESRPVFSVFLVAFSSRVAVATGIYVLMGGSLFVDDSTYWKMAGEVVEGRSAQWNIGTRSLYDAASTYTYPLTVVHLLGGGIHLAGQVLTALFGAVTAAATTRLALEGLPSRWAALAGLAVAFLPSQVLWSSLTLKDAAVWAVLASLGAAIAIVGRSEQLHAPLLTVASIVLSLLLLGNLRLHTTVVAGWAAGIGVWFGYRRMRLVRGLAGLGALVATSLVLGIGAAGSGLVLEAGSLGNRRHLNAQGADTAVIEADGSAGHPSESRAGARPLSSTPSSPSEPGPPPPPRADVPIDSDIRDDLVYLPRGLTVMVLEPLPWRLSGNRSVRLAAIDIVLWYPLLLLAAVGAVTGIRRYSRILVFPLLAGSGITIMYALAEGNFGTAFRHRGEIVWSVAVLAAYGAHRLNEMFLNYRDTSPDPSVGVGSGT